MSATTGRYQTPADLEPAAAEALLRFGLALADTKHRLGRRFSEWSNGAPALEAAVGASAITQDELGHARSLFSMLDDLPGAPPELNSESDLERTTYYNPALLDRPLASWSEVIAALTVLDEALRTIFGAARNSGYAPLAQRAAKILQEEHFHRIYGESWLARLASAAGPARDRLQAALDRAWPVAADWFGPPDDPTALRLAESGILETSPAGLRSAWSARMAAVLSKHGLAVPEYAPDWSRWDGERRQVPHA